MFFNRLMNSNSVPRLDEKANLIRPFFDSEFYDHQLSLRNISVSDSVTHYLNEGWRLNLDPSPFFSTEQYLRLNEDVFEANTNPLLHFISNGKTENRTSSLSRLVVATDENLEFQRKLISQYFDSEWYASTYPDASTSSLSAVEHYLSTGWLEGFDPSADFSTNEYLSLFMRPELEPINPLVHLASIRNARKRHISSLGLTQKDTAEKGTGYFDQESSLVSNSLPLKSKLTPFDIDKFGYEDDVNSTEHESTVVTNQQSLENLRQLEKLNSIVGHIDGLIDGQIHGWFLAPFSNATPVLFVNGNSVTRFEYPVKRSDVNEHLGISGDTGFKFNVGGIEKGSKVELFVLCNGEMMPVATHVSESHCIEENFFMQLAKAHEISKEPNAVAVTCWDGTHNAVGRSKVLYDVVSSKRSSVIIAYTFEGFGQHRPWEPIKNENIALLLIPWARREKYERAIHAAGIKFDTVWIGKGRFPSFELAKLISHDHSAVVLDFDDNEEHFSTSANSIDKAYGLTTINYSRYLTKNITARTAASVTLKNDFDAQMVRHARFSHANRTERKLLDTSSLEENFVLKVGFIGTVRPHKNMDVAARAIKSFCWASKLNVEFHVYGDVNPPKLLSELKSNGVVVKQNTPMSELNNELSSMDIILTGFPGSDPAITEYQISSKIGDALAVGRPVLVPESPSVSDLENTPGVFLFNALDFPQKLSDAITYTGEVDLTEEFTIDGAYSAFSQAEKIACESNLAKQVFDILPEKYEDNTMPSKTLVLLWKQNDSGFYGRRVDQIARSYKRIHPSNRVIILEMMDEKDDTVFTKLSENYTSEHRMLREQFSEKRNGKINGDGVEIHQLLIKGSANASSKMNEFLLDNTILPTNSAFILFPVIQQYQYIERSIRAYTRIVDVVDNQFYWGGSANQDYRIAQYYTLLRSSKSVIFNSAKNRDFFVDNNVVKDIDNCQVIPNWYELPASYSTKDVSRNDTTARNVVYSGNMNDRIDWALLDRISDLSNELTIHLVGTVSRGMDGLAPLLNKENVLYHGPLSEKDTLKLTQKMDLAIMPHSIDSTSTYMNPLKLMMYQAIGIPCVSTNVPGIEENDLVTICNSHQDFLNALEQLLENDAIRNMNVDSNPNSARYMELIESHMPNNDPEDIKTQDRVHAA